jgi:hypothetical protein
LRALHTQLYVALPFTVEGRWRSYIQVLQHTAAHSWRRGSWGQLSPTSCVGCTAGLRGAVCAMRGVVPLLLATLVPMVHVSAHFSGHAPPPLAPSNEAHPTQKEVACHAEQDTPQTNDANKDPAILRLPIGESQRVGRLLMAHTADAAAEPMAGCDLARVRLLVQPRRHLSGLVEGAMLACDAAELFLYLIRAVGGQWPGSGAGVR